MSRLQSSIQFWLRFGLPAPEAGQRAAETHPGGTQGELEDAVALAQSVVAAGGVVEAGGPYSHISYFALPIVPSQIAPVEYKVIVPLYDPSTDSTREQLVIIGSGTTLSYGQIRQMAVRRSSRTIELSPERYATASGGQFTVTPETRADVRVVGASRWG